MIDMPSLVIMAAGMGSRFGGIKQLAHVGTNGEILMDYSIYDALKAGFSKVVFVIRHDIEKDFREIVGSKIENVCDVEYVFQDISDIPERFSVPSGRKKPWGTGHAVLACKNVIREPFTVINADDFYGRDSFLKLFEYLSASGDSSAGNICLAGYRLGNTLSESGGVTRGICKIDEHYNLLSITETSNIKKEGESIVSGNGIGLQEDNFVSMNMWGLQPQFIELLEDGFAEFLSNLPADGSGEYLLPIYIDSLIKKGKAKAKLLPSSDNWFGLTFKEDLPDVQKRIKELCDSGKYPYNLY